MIRVSILGAGIGASHLRGLLQLPETYEVVSVCDLEVERAQRIIDQEAGQGSKIQAVSDLDAVLTDPSIDMIAIGLPPHLHVPVTLKAFEAGKHVVCEKPFATSLEEVDLLEKAAEKAGKVLSPVFQYRYGPETSKLLALRDAGLLGKPFVASLETHWNRGADYYAVPWRGTWAGENGGCIPSHSIHIHDLLSVVMGPIKSVSANVTTLVNDIETEDCAAMSFQMENGSLATSSVTLGAANDTSRIRFVFEHLTAQSGEEPYTPMNEGWSFIARDPAKQAEVDAVLAEVTDVKLGFAAFFDELAKQISGTANNAVTLEDGRKSIELVTAIYHASRTGTAVEMPVTSDNPLYSNWGPQPQS